MLAKLLAAYIQYKDKDKDKECFISIRDIPEFR